MLTPQQVDKYADKATAAFDELFTDILKDMARRIAATGRITNATRYQAARAAALTSSTKYLLKKIAEIPTTVTPQLEQVFLDAMNAADRQDAEAYIRAGRPYVPLEENDASKQLVNSGFRRTMNTLNNLTQTRALMDNPNLPMTQQAQLGQLLDKAHFQITSGAFSYTTAIRQAINTLADKGVGAITYPSGHVDSLDVVVRRAALTGINQTAGDISLNNAMMMGVDTMELSAHAGARTGDGENDFTNHSWWQGKLVSISGRDGYLSFDDIGYGHVQGFMGANCRHNWHPFFEGASVRNYDEAKLEELNSKTIPYNGEDVPLYEAEHKQRAMERRIRQLKRRYVLQREAGLDKDATRTALALKTSRERLADFLQQTGLNQQADREAARGFGRSAAAKASGTALSVRKRLTALNKELTALRNDGKIKATGEAVFPPKISEDLRFNEHAAMRAAERNISLEDAKTFVSTARVALRQRAGAQYVFYSGVGFAAVQNNGEILTFGQLNEGGKRILEAMRKNGF